MEKNVKGSYQTKAKMNVLCVFKSHPNRQFTIEQVIEAICSKKDDVKGNKNGEKIPGISTIYRITSNLCKEGLLKRFRSENNNNYLYQYIDDSRGCSEHLHLKCTECEKIYHLECSMSEKLLMHILDEHGFSIDSGRCMLLGKCIDCADKSAFTKTEK